MSETVHNAIRELKEVVDNGGGVQFTRATSIELLAAIRNEVVEEALRPKLPAAHVNDRLRNAVAQ